ncbi:CHAT domain-containing protein [Candidatus Albibeggiatoa sp. nov. NOAA]|uniref:CHAT domain-containing protein n=1 Tax=Candidatus Albibeggiatoa sp. nov. NOAA TaxID=3162724 RepID=UPI003302F5EF|nr:CHAT domain-containing protein [Thiotrichaceae bacterium]
MRARWFVFLMLFTSFVQADSWQQGFNAYQQQNYAEAIRLWQHYLSNNTPDTDRKILTYSLLGDAKLASNQLQAARSYLDNEEMTQLARQTDNDAVQAHFFNNRANMWMLLLSESKDHRIVKQYYHQAIQDYDVAFYSTLFSNNHAMLVNILSNEIQAHLKTKEKLLALEALLGKLLSRILRPLMREVDANIKNALPQLLIARDHVLFSLDDSNQNKPFLMLSLGQLALRHYRMQPELPIVVLQIAELLFKYTVKLAFVAHEQNTHYDATYIQSYANGLLGQICEYYIQSPDPAVSQNAYRSCSQNLVVGQSIAQDIACEYCAEYKQVCAAEKPDILLCKQDGYANKLAAYEVGLLQTRTAISYALQNAETYTPSLLYLWYWHTGRLLQNKAKLLCEQDEMACTQSLHDALLAYQNAVQVLQPIQSELITEQRNSQEALNERIKPVYFGLAELLLQHAEHDPDQRQTLLESAIQSIESIKKTELQEYFQSNCLLDEADDVLYNLLTDLMQYDPDAANKVEKLPSRPKQKVKQKGLVIPDPNAALLYPIIFDNQISLLLRLANGDIHHIKQQKKNIANKIKEQVYRLRQNLETESRNYKREAKSLYKLFISPLGNLLKENQVETLIIVPDELLRTIPFSALLNPKTKQFLIQEVALVTIPSYDSIRNHKYPTRYFSVMLNGLSQQVDSNFPPLENVESEIQHIQTLFDNPKVLLNQSFTFDSFANNMKLRPYSVIHIASHGQFKADPTETFLLTYDKRLDIDSLEDILKSNQKQGYPVSLLTLSACQTAAGDDRAALGIAGVAIKSGAQSALASLWSVKDDATARLMQAFYQQFTKMSKAKAFQAAQIQLIEAGDHPNHWSAFLLIGSWL